ncbi:BglG family transcription antiterminator [Streptococcus ruminantium]|uniref:BglG family transcription antiterminator n=1 Tax=Streptococcus ruminantium TaxID=1917441 RepID=UPI0012DC3AA4|nr:PRD domain-containing protein [Streptococcus ruminantium]
MLSKKEVRLLECLLAKQDTFVSSLELAKLLAVSDRTVRKYVHQLSSSLEVNGAHILSKQSKGYCLQIDRPVEFEMFWQEQLQLKKRITDLTQLEEAVDRQRYILNKLLFEEPIQSLDCLQKELFIGKTTLHSILSDIRKLFASYQLELLITRRGIKLEGKEPAIRHFIMDYFFGEGKAQSVYGMVETNLLPDIRFTDLMLIVLDECRDAKLRLSDFVMQNLVLHIALLLKRMKIGSSLDQFPISNDIQSSKEYQVAGRIIQRIEKQFQVTIPTEETNYIALHLKVKLTGSPTQVMEVEGRFQHHVESCLRTLSQLTGLELFKDQQLLRGILAHLIPLQTRLENKIQLGNPLTSDIQQQYFEAFELTKSAFATMPELMGYQISDDEWAYLTLHVMAAIERYQGFKKTRVLVVCATGVGSALMLKNRLEKEFSTSLEVVDSVSYHEITEERLRDIDLIISSISLSNLIFLTPVINVSVFLSEKDMEAVRSYLQQVTPVKSEQGEPVLMGEEQARQIAESVFSPQRVLYIQEETSRESVLFQLTMCLNEAVDSDFVDQFLEQVHVRESYSSVVFGDSLAFPHPALPMSFSEQIVVGICQRSVEWGQGKQVQLVFLLSPSKGRNIHLKYVSPCLVEFVKNGALQERLMKNPSYSELIDIFIPLIQKQG